MKRNIELVENIINRIRVKRLDRLVRMDEGEWEEKLHPRDKGGKFTKKGNEEKGGAEDGKKKVEFSEITDDNVNDAIKRVKDIEEEIKNSHTGKISDLEKKAAIGFLADTPESEHLVDLMNERKELMGKTVAHMLGKEYEPEPKYLKPNASTKEKITACENRSRNDKVETAVVVSPDGKILLDKSDGLADIVNFSADEMKLMRDSTFTHNHPNGSPFSGKDLEFALSGGVREIRASHGNGAYVLRRKFDIGGLAPYNFMDFPKDYVEAKKNYMKNVVDGIYAKTHDAKKCDDMVEDFERDWLKKNSKKYGWDYTEEKNG